ncbi:MAG: hypothetical protein R3343_06530 [Nitriliruptorales bacterium]|nr:hypothetical protein [Nitriliruptorales bacterium]
MSEGSSVDAQAVLQDLADIMTVAAERIHTEHRRRAVGWTAAAGMLGLAEIPLVSRGRHASAAAFVAGIFAALLRADRHRRLAAMSDPGHRADVDR